MKPISQKTLNMIQYFKDHPAISVAKVAKKFKTSMPYTYKIRARAREESWQPPEPLPVPEIPNMDVKAYVEGTNVDTVLDTRALDYGKFKDGAALMQAIKRTMAEHAQKHGKTFADDQWEALEMIVHKIGRIVNGNPDKVDHWTDIAGYAKLIADRLEGKVR